MTPKTNSRKLCIYPIKGLRAVPLTSAELTPMGIKHDRRFMLWSLNDDGSLKSKLQVSSNPELAVFSQTIVGEDPSLNEYEPTQDPESPGGLRRDKGPPAITIRYLTPQKPIVPHHPSQDNTLEVPLEPDTSALQPVEYDLFGSGGTAYRMGDPYDSWFSACLGYPAALVHIGNGRRPQLGFRPGPRAPAQNWSQALVSSISAAILYLLSLIGLADAATDWLGFSDMAPFLITSTASLADISSRVEEGPIGMHRFRPNIVIGPGAEPENLLPFEEDFWSQLTIFPSAKAKATRPTFQVTGNCCRCVAVNVDYTTGRPSKGPRGTVFKKLMGYRRVDKGSKYEPIFGRYASLMTSATKVVGLGDIVEATSSSERDVYDWPPWRKAKPKTE